MRSAPQTSAPLADAPTLGVKHCAFPGCGAVAEYRAPKSTKRLNDYHWFCLPHVRDYNAAWNYCAGLSAAEIESVIRFDTIWNRETRPIGGWRSHQHRLYEAAARFRAEDTGGKPADKSTLSAEMTAALELFGLTMPFTPIALRSAYKRLVKQYHPDANGGDKDAEEKLKDVTLAYALLKRFLVD